jgi:sulfate transport system ATP-binding protein
MSVQVRGLRKSFGSEPVLDNVDLSVQDGEFVALLGPSGSGKTTLLRIIAGIETPGAGAVVIDDRDATRLTPGARGIGFVFQHYALFGNMTVFENIAFGLRVLPRRKRPGAEAVAARVGELLQLIQLEGYEKRLPSQLSGGQRQRVALARALAIEPRVLLLDEPFGALDALTRASLQDELVRLVESIRSTVVMVTHDIDEAIFLGDRVVMMTNGPAAKIGDVLDIALPRPRDRLTLASSLEYAGYRQQLLKFLYQIQGIALE